MIVELVPEQTAELIPLARQFFASGVLPGKLNEDHFTASWSSFVEKGIASIIGLLEESGNLIGAIGFLVFNEPNTGDKIAQEGFWFVDKNKRGGMGSIRLLDAAVSKAKEMGAGRFIMVHMNSPEADQISSLYKRKGFTLLECSYVKEL